METHMTQSAGGLAQHKAGMQAVLTANHCILQNHHITALHSTRGFIAICLDRTVTALRTDCAHQVPKVPHCLPCKTLTE